MDILFQNNFDWSPLLLTFKLALITTLFLLLVGIPIAYCLAFSKNRIKVVAEVLIAMPLVLPPTVLGFYLLIAFSPNSIFGAWLQQYLGIQLAFSFTGIVIGSMLYSIPFMVQPMQNAFQSIPKSYIETAMVLGKNKWETLKYVLLPNCKRAILSAIVITFAHTVGEFGVVLMIGGSIPNKTKVASVAIYENVESLNYAGAHQYAVVLFVISFIILLGVYIYNRSKSNEFTSFYTK